MRITWPTFDRTLVEEQFVDASEDLPFFLNTAKRKPESLSLLIKTSLEVVRCGLAVGADHKLLQKALTIAGQASAAIFTAANSNGHPEEIILGDEEPCVYLTAPDNSSIHASRWIQGFFLNAISRQSELVDRMCTMPTELLRHSSTKDPEYRYLFVDALKAFWGGESNCNQIILDALEATDPERSDVRSKDWTLFLDVPQLQLLFYIHNADVDFASNLPKATSLYKQFWETDRHNSWEKFFALELTGLASLAFDRKMSFELNADMVPYEFISGGKTP